MKHVKSPYCTTSPNQLIGSKRCLIKTKKRERHLNMKRTRKRDCCHGNSTVGSFCVSPEVHYWCQVLEQHQCIIFRDFLDFVIYLSTETIYDHQFLNKNLNISGTREDIPKKRKRHSCSDLFKRLLNMQKLFFTS